MTLARLVIWVPGQILTAADLNNEFNNILNKPIQLISPTTGAIDFNLQAHTNLLPSVVSASSGSAGNALVVSGGAAVWGTPTVPSSVITPTGSTGQVFAVTSSNTAPTFRVIPIDGGLSTTPPTAGMMYYISSSAALLLGLPATSTNALSTGSVLMISTNGLPIWDARYRSMQKWNMGTSVVSATTMVLSSDGNYYQVSSSTAPTITNISTATAGTLAVLEFLSTMQMAHSSDRILLDGRVNTLLSSGDAMLVMSVSSTGAWREVARTRAYGTHYNLDIRTSGVTIANTAVETTMYSVTIPGGTLQGKRRVQIDIECAQQAATVTSSNARTYRLYVGGVNSITSALSNTWTGVGFNGATTGSEFVLFQFKMSPYGSSSAMGIEWFGDAFFAGMPFATHQLTSIDWSADQKVDLTAQWSSANANNSIVVKAAHAYVI